MNALKKKKGSARLFLKALISDFFSSFPPRASGTNIAAIDNKIEQAMVSPYHASNRVLKGGCGP